MNKYWNDFLKSGKVEDYLKYKRKQREEKNEHRQNGGNNPKGNRV